MDELTGLSAFPITPSSSDGRVDTASLRRLVAPLRLAGVDSIGILGSTGSYPYLSREERRRALDTALEEAGAVPVLVGVGALRTDEAIRIAQDAKAAGATAGLLAPVSYTPLTDAEVFEHFSAVARVSGLPLCIYDNPSTTHFRFSPELVGRLSRVEGILAVKAPAPDAPGAGEAIAALRGAAREGFRIGFSGDWNAVEALLSGGDAWYSVAAGLFPERCLRMVKAVRSGDADEARRLDAAMRPLWDLYRRFTSLRVMYACADILGLASTAPPRPVLPLPEEARRQVAAMLAATPLG